MRTMCKCDGHKYRITEGDRREIGYSDSLDLKKALKNLRHSVYMSAPPTFDRNKKCPAKGDSADVLTTTGRVVPKNG